MERLEFSEDQIGNRSQLRTNMFVMASMSAAAVSGPVRIRNLSKSGGLIEGTQLPDVGEALELRRGALSASGRVVWRSGGKAGLRLDQPVTPSDWLPSGHSGQKAVDNTFQQLKSSSCNPPQSLVSHSSRQPFDASQLRQTADALDALAKCLAEETALIVRHAEKLQVLDIAAQLIRKIAAME